jgi:hypothetical protein
MASSVVVNILTRHIVHLCFLGERASERKSQDLYILKLPERWLRFGVNVSVAEITSPSHCPSPLCSEGKAMDIEVVYGSARSNADMYWVVGRPG